MKSITIDHVLEIAEKYKCNVKKKFKEARASLFSTYLKYCLKDNKLDDNETDNLRHLREILFLNEQDTKEIINIITKEIYEKELLAVLEDGKLDSNEEKSLKLLSENLLLSPEVANDLYEEKAKQILKSFIDNAISDERLSPEEEKEIETISKNLGIKITTDDQTKGVLDKYKLYWQIENADLPVLDSDIKIQKSENLHFKTEVDWLEQRRVTKRINYAGPTARIKIAKGVYYRMGSIQAQSISEDVWQTIDRGTVYLTNKRLIFMGAKGNKTIRLNKILNIQPYKNGVDIQKDTGKSPFLQFQNNTDIFSMILVRLIDEI